MNFDIINYNTLPLNKRIIILENKIKDKSIALVKSFSGNPILFELNTIEEIKIYHSYFGDKICSCKNDYGVTYLEYLIIKKNILLDEVMILCNTPYINETVKIIKERADSEIYNKIDETLPDNNKDVNVEENSRIPKDTKPNADKETSQTAIDETPEVFIYPSYKVNIDNNFLQYINK